MKEHDIKGFIENERMLYPKGRHYSHKTKLTDKKVKEDILFYHKVTPYRW